MTKAEYAQYQANFDAFLKREGIDSFSTGSLDHDYVNPCESDNHMHDDNGDYANEPYFSWSPCDCCGTTLGGHREDCIAYNPNTKEIQGDYRICEDCIYYNEYGQLDDMTMLEMED